MMGMENVGELKFLKVCHKKHFFDDHSRVLVALSGGQDSMTLFNWLYDLQEKLGIVVAVAHVNHKVRIESDAEEQFLRKKMEKLDIPFFTATFTGKFSEAAARKFRYQFFSKVMNESNYSALVTAHHLDDQAETVFMRLLTGRRLRFLTGIQERQSFANGELIRPLLSFHKEELDAAIYFEDFTNHENEHLRNRVRNLYLPELSQENPQFCISLADLSNEISRATRLIHQQIEDLSILSDKIDLKRFLSQKEDLQYFILQEYLANFSDLQLSKGQFDQFLHIIRRPEQYSELLSDQYYLVKSAEEFHLTKSLVHWELELKTENPNDSDFLTVCLPKNLKYSVRKRLPGDTIRIHGHHKSLKKFFIDNKISLEMRAAPVIAVNSEIYAVPVLHMISDLSNRLENATIKQTIWVKPKEQ
ncbi:MAG: tRNA lysidine(34) synthetase TilS [Streptococcaceae bacterium]|jgi:tRNA(Ile)-lysidine synthase|nr:tRNA lysidine(34) synthetase TilS [Streptococcaceae bacterium]